MKGNRITVVALDDLPASILEDLQPYFEEGTLVTLELSRRFCQDCGVRWRSVRQRDLEATLDISYRHVRHNWAYQDAGYE